MHVAGLPEAKSIIDGAALEGCVIVLKNITPLDSQFAKGNAGYYEILKVEKNEADGCLHNATLGEARLF